jgi:hypothetical protein
MLRPYEIDVIDVIDVVNVIRSIPTMIPRRHPMPIDAPY